MAKSDLPVKMGEVVSLGIGGLTHNGEGVGRCRGLAVFVPGGPGPHGGFGLPGGGGSTGGHVSVDPPYRILRED